MGLLASALAICAWWLFLGKNEADARQEQVEYVKHMDELRKKIDPATDGGSGDEPRNP